MQDKLTPNNLAVFKKKICLNATNPDYLRSSNVKLALNFNYNCVLQTALGCESLFQISKPSCVNF